MRAAAVAMLLVVLGTGLFVSGVFAAPVPPTPVLDAPLPPNPSNAASWTFNYHDSQAGVTFQCRTDANPFAGCPGTTSGSKLVSGLTNGSHTFDVQALSGGKASSSASYTWVVDLTPPAVSSINRIGTSPTSASSVSWTVTFSENVTGVDATDFAVAPVGVSGAGAIAVSPVSASVYTVSANTGTGSGTLGLNLSDNDSIADVAGNKLGGTGAGNGNFTGQLFTIDKTAPNVTAIGLAGASPTNAASVSWSVSFSENVTGVDASDFQLVNTGLGGSPSINSVSGSGAAYTVSASTGSGVGTLRLNLVDDDSIVDGVGNKLGGSGANNGNFTGQQYSIDRMAPATPTLTLTPPDPSINATSHFAWSDSTPADVDHYECSKENGAFATCPNPYTYAVVTTNDGLHQFSVRAVDAVGNLSGSASYSWKVDKGSPQEFTVSGSVTGLHPGQWLSIPVTITNPNGETLYVTGLTVTVSGAPNGCDSSSNVETQPSAASPVNKFSVPANAVGYPVPATYQPKIRLKNTSSNQDDCKSQTFSLSYSGTGTNQP